MVIKEFHYKRFGGFDGIDTNSFGLPRLGLYHLVTSKELGSPSPSLSE
jgi:hypothetical protein